MKPVDIKSNTYINSNQEINNKDPKFKIADIVRISKYKNIFANGYVPNWSKEVFVLTKVKSTAPQTFLIADLTGKELVGMFYEKEIQKTNQKEFRIEKETKNIINYMLNGKVMTNSFNSWNDKKAQYK